MAGDFNGDGRTDLAAGDGNGFVSVLLGNGDGTFQPATEYAAGSNPGAIVAGDFNGDGRLDLAVTDQGDANGNGTGVSILLGNGDGTFQAPQEYAAGNYPASLVPGDFNGDGQLDLAVGDLGGRERAAGQRRRHLPGPAGDLPRGGESRALLLAGDFTGDGRLDLAVADGNDDTVSVLLGNGDGTFQAPNSFATRVIR